MTVEPFLLAFRAIALLIGLFWLGRGFFVLRGSETPSGRRVGLIVCAMGVLAALGVLAF